MKIQVKFFASLREQMGTEAATVEVGPQATIEDVWREAAGERPMPANLLVAVNMDYADVRHPVQDGDEVAFFPPVTGGQR